MGYTRDFPAAAVRAYLVGQMIIGVEDSTESDDGHTLILSNGTRYITRFSGCQGDIVLETTDAPRTSADPITTD